ncbi:MAG: NrsF family protein [Polyangiaceae bacterium]|jgi:hypothetical protein
MSDDLDLDRIGEIPDPIANIARVPMPPLRAPIETSTDSRAHRIVVRALCLSGALLYEAGCLVAFNKRSDLSTMPRLMLLAEMAIPLVAGLLAFAAAVSSGERGIGQPKGRVVGLALGGPALFALGTLALARHDIDAEPFVEHLLRCVLVTSIFTIGPLLLAARAYRRAFAAAAAWRGAALGASCGALGTAAMSLVCSVGSPAHVLIGHGSVIVFAALAGAAIGRRSGES